MTTVPRARPGYWVWPLGSLLVLLAAAGCDDGEGGATLGELDRVGFSYQRSCFFGCPLSQPLLSGTRETISLSKLGDAADVRAVSSSKKILEVAMERECYCERDDGHGGRIEIADDASCDEPFEKHCDNSILVQANGPGDAILELHDDAGDVVDRATVLVRDADSAEISATYADKLGSVHDKELEIGVGEKVDLSAELYDDEGRKLLAPEGVRWRSNDAKVADVSAWLLGSGAEIDAGLDVVVTGHAVGQTDVTVDVPGLELSVRVKVSGSK